MTKLTERQELAKILARLQFFDPGAAILDPPIAGGRRDYPFGTRFEPDKQFILNDKPVSKGQALLWLRTLEHVVIH